MGGSSNPTVKDQLTTGQEGVDRLLARSLLGMPGAPIPEDWAQQLGLPKGTPFPFSDLFGTQGAQNPAGQYRPGMGTYVPTSGGANPGQGAGSNWSGLPGATPWLQPGSQLDPFTGQAVPEYRDVNAPMYAGMTNAANWMSQLNPTQGIGEAWQALQPAMQGRQSMNFSPLSAGPRLGNLNPLPNLNLRQQRAGPDVNVPRVNAPANLNLPNVGAGPRLQMGNLQQLPQFQYQQQSAGPNLGNLNFTDNYRYQNVDPAQRVNAERVNLDTSYRYNPFQQQNIAGNTGQATDRYNFTPGSVRTTLNNANNTQNYFQQGVMNPLMRQYDTAIKPRLADTMAAAGNTFSTRNQAAQQQALEGLTGQATAELSRAVREDELTRAAQDLQAQQFNVGTATQNAQFGGQLQQGYDLANMQRALQIAGMNQQERQFGHTADTAGQFNQANFLNQSRLAQAGANNAANFQAAGINNQALQFAQGLNAQGNYQDAALNAQMQQAFAGLNTQRDLANQQNRQFFSNLNTQGALGGYNANLQNALGFGQLNTQRATQAAQINNQAQQFAQGLNSSQALQQFGLNSGNALNFGQLNTGNLLNAAGINNQNRQFYSGLDQQGQLAQFGQNLQNQLGFGQLNTQRAGMNMNNQLAYDTLNTQTQTGLAEAAANRQMQSAGLSTDMLNNQWNRTMQQLTGGSQVQQMLQGRSDREQQEFLRQAPENNPWLKMLMNYRGTPTDALAFGQGDQLAQGINYAAGGLGAGVSLLTLLPMLGALI